MPKLSNKQRTRLLSKMIDDFEDAARCGSTLPSRKSYSIPLDNTNPSERISARKKAIATFKENTIIKRALDTRKVDQEFETMPRRNLQFWHRSDPFIDTEDNRYLDTYRKIHKVTTEIKSVLGREPEWHDSYARQLHENLERIVRAADDKQDVFKPQLAYLEQIMDARYRVEIKDLERMDEAQIRKAIMSKDELLEKKGEFLHSIGMYQPVMRSTGYGKESDIEKALASVLLRMGDAQNQRQSENQIQTELIKALANNKQEIVIKNEPIQDNFMQHLFNTAGIEKTDEGFERTITITIKDGKPKNKE